MAAGLLAGALIGGGISLAKGLFGAVQSAKANKGIKRLLNNPVTYTRPEEYAKQLAMREQGLSGDLPGRGLMEQNIGLASASARGAAEKGAISSNTYMKSVGDIYSKQLAAFRDLGIQSAQWKDQQKDKYESTLQQGAGYSDTEFEMNKLRPWEQKMNMYQSQKQSGGANLWSGLEGIGTSAMNYFGTKYMGNMLSGLQGGGNANDSIHAQRSGSGFQSPPLGGGYDPQANLNSDLSTSFGEKVNDPRVQWQQKLSSYLMNK